MRKRPREFRIDIERKIAGIAEQFGGVVMDYLISRITVIDYAADKV